MKVFVTGCQFVPFKMNVALRGTVQPDYSVSRFNLAP